MTAGPPVVGVTIQFLEDFKEWKVTPGATFQLGGREPRPTHHRVGFYEPVPGLPRIPGGKFREDPTYVLPSP